MEPKDFVKGEILLIDKPLKWTSFDVVNYVRKVLNKVKVGHAGTLDPLATGLLILCTGAMTKKIDDYQGQEKEYEGTFYLGKTTPSFDHETEPDKEFDTSHITKESIFKAAEELSGTYEQLAPMYSAKKVDGERAYIKARKGESVEIKKREITVTSFEVTNIELPLIHFKITCSKGTYIRAIARDLGVKLNSGAFLNSLRRTRIGNFHVNNAMTIEEFRAAFSTLDRGKDQ
jgi:tRNA pseudouridine55 synthase